MSRYQRTKGASAERAVCALLNSEFGVNVHRELSQSRDGGRDISLPPFSIECKRYARIGKVYDWLEQAEIASGSGETPIVIARADHRDWIVVMRFIDWARLAREEIACGGNDSRTTPSAAATGGSPSSPSATDADLPSTTTAP